MKTQRCNQTGTDITWGRADAMDIDSDVDYQWATLCGNHGRFMVHRTAHLARSHAASPIGWCPDCAARNGGYPYGAYLIRGTRESMFVSVYMYTGSPAGDRLISTSFMDVNEAIRWIDRKG